MSAVYLPQEVWLRVLASFCYHCNRDCNRPPVPDNRVDWREWPSKAATTVPTATLANLCRASRMLNGLATPLLYHMPFTRKPTLLLRTLTTCPTLASHVRELHRDMWLEWPWQSLDDYPPAFNERLGRLKDHIREHQDSLSESDLADWIEDESDEEASDSHLTDTVIMALLPNLTSISVESHYRSVGLGSALGSLPKVTSAHIAHGDTEGFMSLSHLKFIAEAAPNITSLLLNAAGAGERTEFPIFANVSVLGMQSSAIGAAAWPSLLRAFPRLERLAYRGSQPSEYSDGGHPRDIQNALIQHCPGLKQLCVDFGGLEYIGNLEETDRAFDRGLESLKHLEYLATDAKSVGKPELEDGEENGDVTGICQDYLPASLKTLRIFCRSDKGEVDIGNDLLQLAGEVSKRLPVLEQLSIVAWPGILQNDDLRTAWEETGVTLTFEVGVGGMCWDAHGWTWPAR